MNLAGQNMDRRKAASRGFTLIELLIVVVIVGLLSLIAVPSYSSYVVRGKIVDGQSALADYRVKIEQYYQDHRTYVGLDGNTCGGIARNTQYFAFACSNVAATTYTVTATGQGLPATYTFTIDQDNAKTTTSFPGVSGTKPCWLIKGSEC